MKIYVLGFLFDTEEENVALIKKTKPEWQAGKLNGIGGKVEEGEFPIHAMEREFKEETGYLIPEYGWNYYATMVFPEAMVNVFYARVRRETLFNELRDMTDEKIDVIDIRTLQHRIDIIPNLRWLIPMALIHRHDNIYAHHINHKMK